jgi:hypothetical protein
MMAVSSFSGPAVGGAGVTSRSTPFVRGIASGHQYKTFYPTVFSISPPFVRYTPIRLPVARG